jgi:Ca2+/Na+ antiporter
MDFLVYGLPIILAFSFIYSNFIIKKAEKKLDFEFVNKLQVIKEKERKKIFLFLFFPIFYLSLNTILNKFEIEFYFIIAFIFLFIFIILFMFYKKYNNFKNQNFPDDFLNEIIKSESIKLIGIVSVFVFIFISF